MIRDCIRTPGGRFAYIAPTYKQAKNIAWDYVKFYSRPIPGVTFNESELRADYPNGSRLSLYGSENIDALRGIGLNGGAQDESSQQPSNLFSEVISKCLADHLGYWIWLGTPQGKNQFYDTYQTALKNPEEYFSCFKTIDDTLATEQGQTVENLRVALDDDKKLLEQGIITKEEFEQEWYCSFEAAIRGAYYADQLSKALEENRISNVPHDPRVQVETWWDLGIGDAMSIWFTQSVGQEIRLIDYYESHGVGIDHYARVLQERGYVYKCHHMPHDVEVRELSDGVSRKEKAEALGLTPVEVGKRLPVDDGINAVRMIFPKLWIDVVKCREGIEALKSYKKEWDDKRGEFKKTPYHDWCLSGETKVRTLSGWKEIKDIQAGDYVWGYSKKEKRLVPSKVTRAGVTRKNADLLEIGLDNGKKIKATPDHQFMLRDESFKRADELQVGDSLMPFYEQLDRFYVKIDLNDGTFCDEHRFVFNRFNGHVENGFHVDHIDNDHFNNYPDNLQVLCRDEHCSKTFSGLNNQDRKDIDKTDYDREFYNRKELFLTCKFCGNEYWGSFKTIYCSNKCRKAYRRKRDQEGLVPSRKKEVVNAKCREAYRKKNHKVRYINKICKREDTYDLEVPETGSFVAEGVVVHNSSHAADALRLLAQEHQERTERRSSGVLQKQIKRSRNSAVIY